MPRSAAASAAAFSARARTSETRSPDSALRRGAPGCASTSRTYSGMFTLLFGLPSPSASHGTSYLVLSSLSACAIGPESAIVTGAARPRTGTRGGPTRAAQGSSAAKCIM